MKVSPVSALFATISLAALSLGLGTFGEASAPKVKYAQIKAILDTKCVKCHNTARPAERIDLSNYKAIMKGGRGPIVVPGKPGKSDLIAYVDGSKSPRMPLKAAPLTAKEIAKLKKWIADGAK